MPIDPVPKLQLSPHHLLLLALCGRLPVGKERRPAPIAPRYDDESYGYRAFAAVPAMTMNFMGLLSLGVVRTLRLYGLSIPPPGLTIFDLRLASVACHPNGAPRR